MENPPVAQAIIWIELGLVVFLALALGKLKWFIRIPLASLLGWPVIAVGTVVLWRILADSASTPAEMDYVVAHDGGPIAVAMLFGWIYALVVVLAVEAIRAVVRLVRRKRSDALQP